MRGARRLVCALASHGLRLVAKTFVAACRLVLALARACERGARP